MINKLIRSSLRVAPTGKKMKEIYLDGFQRREEKHITPHVERKSKRGLHGGVGTVYYK